MNCANCGHPKSAHIYNEGACRPGFRCQEKCEAYREPNLEPSRLYIGKWFVTTEEQIVEVRDSCLMKIGTSSIYGWVHGVEFVHIKDTSTTYVMDRNTFLSTHKEYE